MVKKFGIVAMAVLAGVVLSVVSANRVHAAEDVRIAGLTWPGYGFWFIADEVGLAPDLEISYQAIEDPFQTFALAAAGQLDVVSSTIEFAPIAAAEGIPVKLVAYGNISYGTDKIVVGPGIESAADLVGKKVAVLEGGLAQLYMAIWLEQNGVAYDEVEYVNLIMDDAASAMIGGDVAAAEFWEPFGTQVLEAREGTSLAAHSREPFWLQNALIADALFMNATFIQDRRDVALKTMKALYDAIAWWRENPAEGNEIIARRMKMSLEDVELVIGKDGTGTDGGLYPYSFIETARFCGAAPGEPPFGQSNGQIADHWRMTNDWWIRFGLMSETIEPSRGTDCSLLADLHGTGYGG
ncbi:MAG: ABC transporter substrate-binding protein [bacterium]|nr:ABC transporter substrate-binding protein [bacterium]